MQDESVNGNDKSYIRFKVMIINTAALKQVLEDKDFDGITLQLSQAIGNTPGADPHTFRFIAYKHFSSKKKQEQITDPNFFAGNNETEIFKNVAIGGDGNISHFGNLKFTRADMKEDVDTNEYPYLILSPDHGTGDYENYVVFHPFYTDNLNAAPPQTQALSRGMSATKSIAIKAINPSPPA